METFKTKCIILGNTESSCKKLSIHHCTPKATVWCALSSIEILCNDFVDKTKNAEVQSNEFFPLLKRSTVDMNTLGFYKTAANLSQTMYFSDIFWEKCLSNRSWVCYGHHPPGYKSLPYFLECSLKNFVLKGKYKHNRASTETQFQQM
jgi:hypothetical protein